MRLKCPRCHTSYVDPSPAAEVEPIGCPWCGHTTAAPTEPPDVTAEGIDVTGLAKRNATGQGRG